MAKKKGSAIKASTKRQSNRKASSINPKKKPVEQYDHKDKERVNNPPVGLVDEKTDVDIGKKKYAYDPHIDPALQFDCQRSQIEKIVDDGLAADNIDDAKAALEEIKKRQEPYLNWAGKAERTTFEVPTVSLHVHERIDPRTIIEAVRKKNGQNWEQTSLFSSPEENPPLREAIEFYKHKHNWTNRLIAGDSLVVMNSLLEKEGLAGQVQMIYIDPPYGIKYGSNFQPFINKRDVKDGKDEDLTQEPEMIKAFRDTWEFGLHSYLSYLRDRILLAKKLLKEEGSIFLQISDENIHKVRVLLDEIFGKDNFISIITFKKTAGRPTKGLMPISDYLLWYGRNRSKIKYHQLFIDKPLLQSMQVYNKILLDNGEHRSLTSVEKTGNKSLPNGKLYTLADIYHQGETEGGSFEFEFQNRIFKPPKGKHWKTTIDGIKRLAEKIWLEIAGDTLRYRRFLKDFPVSELTNNWVDVQGVMNRNYVVETNETVIQRCLLMATDPGDLVFDPTCGSGTTAFVAEQWGRRWITCDTSRVSIALAKQRLMTALYDYYELAHQDEGVGSGFQYTSVPHITLKSIANDEPPTEEVLYDSPYIDKSKARVSGPFTVEAVPAPIVKPIDDIQPEAVIDESVTRSGETLRQSEWRDELFRTGIRGKAGQRINFTRVETLPTTRWLHADAETKGEKVQRVVISFGPEHALLEQRQVALAIEEAHKLVPKPEIIVFAAFRFDPEAAKDIDETEWPGVTLLKAEMNADMLTEDLKKKRSSNESFWLIGQPDIIVNKFKDKDKPVKYQVEVLGFDYYNTVKGTVESGGIEKIAMWMLDTDYDGRSLFPRQVFFPMAGEKDGWHRLAKNLKAEIDEELIEAYRGNVSLPFEPGDYKRIAVKIIDDRGIESLRIMEIE